MDVVVGPAVCGTGGRVAVRNGEEKELLLVLPMIALSGTDREMMECEGGGERSILAEFGMAIGGVVD